MSFSMFYLWSEDITENFYKQFLNLKTKCILFDGNRIHIWMRLMQTYLVAVGIAILCVTKQTCR